MDNKIFTILQLLVVAGPPPTEGLVMLISGFFGRRIATLTPCYDSRHERAKPFQFKHIYSISDNPNLNYVSDNVQVICTRSINSDCIIDTRQVQP